MRTEQLGEKFRLRLAQLRELLRDVGDRAVVLAQLLALLGWGALRAVAAYPSSLRALASASARFSAGTDSTAARYAPDWAAIRARAKAAIACSPPSCSAIQRRASAASLSYDWSKASRPQSVSAKTLAGRPRVRAP